MSQRQIADSIQERCDAWRLVPDILRQVFPDPSADAVADAVDAYCRRTLGAGIEQALFFDASVGSVHGLLLQDGRRVVVKVHAPETSRRFLAAVQAVQERLWTNDFPAPRPLASPTPLARGVATVESMLEDGATADAHRPEVRRQMAAGLARLVVLCRPLICLDGLRDYHRALTPDALWPSPHDGRFDFERTSAGAEWIDAIARVARPLFDAPAGESVVGHDDWRAQNMRFAHGQLNAVYDWDSLRVMPEADLVGSVAWSFTTDWRAPAGHRQFPDLTETLAFIADYEQTRGIAFDGAERCRLHARLVYGVAYTARCEHSDAVTDMGRRARPLAPPAAVPADSARAYLIRHAGELLAVPRADAPTVVT